MSQDTILIIDFMELNRIRIKNVLKEFYHILEASNEQEAMRIIDANKNNIKAIIIDSSVLQSDNYALVGKIKERKTYLGAPLIATISDSSEENILKCYKSGILDMIKIPFEPDIILKKINNHIERFKNNSTK